MASEQSKRMGPWALIGQVMSLAFVADYRTSSGFVITTY
jgi:hypothetical protein